MGGPQAEPRDRGNAQSGFRPPGWRTLPPLARAFLRYAVKTRDPALVPVTMLQREVDGEIDRFTADIFADVEAALHSGIEDGRLELTDEATDVRFDYDTRLLLPAMLTHGRLHIQARNLPLARTVRRVNTPFLTRARSTTREIVRALLDGDMRDAINDDEFADFQTTVKPREEAARIAQSCLEDGVEQWLSDPETPPDVGKHYRRAVRFSEGHQDRDRQYRDLLANLTEAKDDAARRQAARAVRTRYRDADPDAPADLFTDQTHLPYFGTQYERVGIIYEDMLNMYEAALSIDLGRPFKRSLVLMVIAAQVGLDDTDDYPVDKGTQLTPVTAELNLHEPGVGIGRLRRIVLDYLDRAAQSSPDHLTGMAIEFIRQEALDRLATLEQTVTLTG